MRPLTLLILCLILLIVLTACWTPRPPTAVQSQINYQVAGDVKRGAVLLKAYGCIACHSVAGINDYNARVGPPLHDWADRRYVAGIMENTPANLKQWIQTPQQIKPGSAMPNLHVSDTDAEDIVAYLFSLGEAYEPLR